LLLAPFAELVLAVALPAEVLLAVDLLAVAFLAVDLLAVAFLALVFLAVVLLAGMVCLPAASVLLSLLLGQSRSRGRAS
jgi:hypothetical protein